MLMTVGIASSTATQPYNLDIRNAPIAEESVDNATAMASVASALRAVGPLEYETAFRLSIC